MLAWQNDCWKFRRHYISPSSFDVTTFKNLARKRTFSFTEHEVVSGKPYLQRGHEGLEVITFDMVLDKALNPLPKDCRECQDKLCEMQSTGDAVPLVIGTSYIGNYVLFYYLGLHTLHAV